MDGNQYITVFQNKLLPSIKDFGMLNAIFQQDTAPCHVCKKVKKYMSDEFIDLLGWPGYSPDLNLIENIWSILKRKVALKISRNKRELIENIINVWKNEMPKELPNKFIAGMASRIKRVIVNKGFSVLFRRVIYKSKISTLYKWYLHLIHIYK